MFLMLVLGMWCFWLEPASLRVEEADLFVSWPYPRPLRIAVVSDLHVGAPYYGLSGLRKTVDRINSTSPDLVTMLGDFVNLGVLGGRFTPPEPIAEEFGDFAHPSVSSRYLGTMIACSTASAFGERWLVLGSECWKTRPSAWTRQGVLWGSRRE